MKKHLQEVMVSSEWLVHSNWQLQLTLLIVKEKREDGAWGKNCTGILKNFTLKHLVKVV